MGIVSTIESAGRVGHMQVIQIGSAYYVGSYPISADGTYIGPWQVNDTNNTLGPYPWRTIGSQYWVGPWEVS